MWDGRAHGWMNVVVFNLCCDGVFLPHSGPLHARHNLHYTGIKALNKLCNYTETGINQSELNLRKD